MIISLNIPPEHERALREALGQDLGRAALDALVIEGYRNGRLSTAEVGKLLGIGDRWEVNKWLAERRVPLNYSIDDFDSDRQTLDRLLGKTA